MNRLIRSICVLAVAGSATFIATPGANATEGTDPTPTSTGSTRITITNNNTQTITDTLIRQDGSIETIVYEIVTRPTLDGVERRICDSAGCIVDNWRNDGSWWEQACLGFRCNEPKKVEWLTESSFVSARVRSETHTVMAPPHVVASTSCAGTNGAPCSPTISWSFLVMMS